jgi:hypothetical protein
MKKCSTFLVIKELQIKTLRFHLTRVEMSIINNINNKNAGKDVGKREPLSIVDWNVN